MVHHVDTNQSVGTVRKEFASDGEHYPKTEGYVFNWRFNLDRIVVTIPVYSFINPSFTTGEIGPVVRPAWRL